MDTAWFWFSVLAAVSTVVGAISGGLAFHFGKERDAARDADLSKDQSDAAASIALANQLAAEANERAGRLELESQVQRERAAKAELALAELLRRTTARTLSGAQREAILNSLRGKTTIPVEVSSPAGDHEAENFADQLMGVFRQAGLDAEKTVTLLLPYRRGGVIEIKKNVGDEDDSTLIALHHALDSARMAVLAGVSDKVPKGQVHVLVGHKP